MTAAGGFPFSAVVGQDQARVSLLLATIDPAIGGVLLRGDKGSAKSTLARGLAALLPDDAPFVELPLGATEDRVLGSLDLRAALEGESVDRFRPGLLAAAHGGVLYVDEVNLLPDHLVDALLDVAASGINRVERDGVSHEHTARFVLVGSMNPEEGELRPQLLDRFGLAVEVRSPQDPELRAEAVRRRLTFDSGTQTPEVSSWTQADDELRTRLTAARPAGLTTEVLLFAARTAVEVEAESLRADLVLCRAAAALAGWEGRRTATTDDVARVAPMVLAHRRRRRPFDPPTLPGDDLDEALNRARNGLGAGSQPDTSPPDPVVPETPAAPAHMAEPDGGDDAPQDEPPEPELVTPPGGTSVDPGGDLADPEPEPDPDHHGYEGDNTEEIEPALLPSPPDTSTSPPPHQPQHAPEGGRRHLASGLASAATQRWDDLAGDAMASPPAPVAIPLEPMAAPRPRPIRPSTIRQSDPPSRGQPAARTENGERGRVVGERQVDAADPGDVAVVPTVRAALRRRAADPSGPPLQEDDLRGTRRVPPRGRAVVLAVDTSGSMGTVERVTAASGAVLGLLADAYLRRDRVALVAFRGSGASEVLPPTASVELARTRLADLETGGPTPLAEGIATALTVAQRTRSQGSEPLLVLLTDGRATGNGDALDHARQAADAVARADVEAIVLDAEDDREPLGLAKDLAALMGGRYVHLSEISAPAVEIAIRNSL